MREFILALQYGGCEVQVKFSALRSDELLA